MLNNLLPLRQAHGLLGGLSKLFVQNWRHFIMTFREEGVASLTLCFCFTLQLIA